MLQDSKALIAGFRLVALRVQVEKNVKTVVKSLVAKGIALVIVFQASLEQIVGHLTHALPDMEATNVRTKEHQQARKETVNAIV